jgi:hypothetical protein
MSKSPIDKILFTIKTEIDKTRPLISEIEKLRGTRVIILFCGDESIDHIMCLRTLKLLRRLSKIDKLDLFIDSGGGDIDAACKMVKILKQYSNSFSVIVPFMAKSAATLIALNAEELVMCKASELGVADPQVREPITGTYVPAHSIKEAISFIEEVNDPYVKLSLADKLPPLLIGAFRDAQNAAKQYITEALEKLEDKKSDAIHTFTEKYLSHGYPIDRNLCKEVGLNILCPDEKLEKVIYDLFEVYADLMLSLLSKPKIKTFSVIQANSEICISINGKDITSQFKEFEKALEQKSELKCKETASPL